MLVMVRIAVILFMRLRLCLYVVIAALGEIEGTPLDVARQLFEVNFWGAINVAREAVRFFREENEPSGGYLLNVSSLASLVGPPGLGFYGSAKSGMSRSFMKPCSRLILYH